MPHTGTSTVSRSPSSPTSTGRAQEPTRTKTETLDKAPRPHVCRHEPVAFSSSSSSSSSGASLPRHHHPPNHRSLRLHVGVFSKRKGVRYNADGRVVKCRFCEILRDRDEPFLYEDESLVIFRPLHPIVPSHILIVPRAHIRNVNQLNVEHVDLLRRMRAVGERVLHSHPDLEPQPLHRHDQTNEVAAPKKTAPKSPNDVTSVAEEYPGLTMADLDEEIGESSDSDCRFAFHVPPFNSIDHVHMHAFRGETGYFGRIKYRTESWWCRSYDEVLARLELQQQHPQLASEAHGTLAHHAGPTAPPPAPVICTQ